MFKKPTVSVIIPTYNRAHLVGESIQSVLNQTYQDFEVIIVDDGSTDNTEEIIKEFQKNNKRIRYIQHKQNRGGAAARNTGIETARGQYIAFLDSDDEWLSTKLEKQVKVLEDHKDYAGVYTNLICVDENNKPIGVGFKQNQFPSGYIFYDVLLWKAAFGPVPTIMVITKCFEEIGCFDTEFVMAHDRDMAVRLAKRYKLYGMKEPLVKVREHSGIRVRNRATKEYEYYWFKLLNKLFKENVIPDKIKKQLIAGYYFRLGRGYTKEKEASLARQKFLQSIKYYPFKIDTYVHLTATLMGKKGLGILLKIRKWALQMRRRFNREIS